MLGRQAKAYRTFKMQIGTVKQIWRYALKSMSGEQLVDCTIGKLGIPGDRGWALRDETTGEITNAKRFPVLMQCSAKYLEPPTSEFIPNVEIKFPDGTVVQSDDSDINKKWRAREHVAERAQRGPCAPPGLLDHLPVVHPCQPHHKCGKISGAPRVRWVTRDSGNFEKENVRRRTSEEAWTRRGREGRRPRSEGVIVSWTSSVWSTPTW